MALAAAGAATAAAAAASGAGAGAGAEEECGLAPSTYEDEHEAFAASRWNDYVFVANDPRSLAALDKHVEAPADEVALPLVVLGEPGACARGSSRFRWIESRKLVGSID